MDLHQLIDIDNEEATQGKNVQYLRKMNFEKDLIEKSVEYAVAFEKL